MGSNRWKERERADLSCTLSLSLLFFLPLFSLSLSYPSLFSFHPTSVMIPSDKWYTVFSATVKYFVVMMSSVILESRFVSGTPDGGWESSKILRHSLYGILLLLFINININNINNINNIPLLFSVSITESIQLAAFGSVSVVLIRLRL